MEKTQALQVPSFRTGLGWVPGGSAYFRRFDWSPRACVTAAWLGESRSVCQCVATGSWPWLLGFGGQLIGIYGSPMECLGNGSL